jgi:ribosomal protein L7/L12
MSGGDPTWKDINAAMQGLAKRLDYIEEHLVHMGAAVGYRYAPMNSELPPEIKELVRAGKTLDALKRYREVTGASLEQAKAVVMGL